MFDRLPPALWVSLIAAFLAYLQWRRIRQVVAAGQADALCPGRRDDPPVPPLFASVALLLLTIGVGIFVWTEAFERFVRSGWLILLIAGAMEAICLTTLVRAARTGRIEPLVRGATRAYDVNAEPKRFWASVVWNVAMALLFIAAPVQLWKEQRVDGCIDPPAAAPIEESIAACDRLLAQPDISAVDRSHWLTGRAWAQVDEADEPALADLEQALELDPDNAWASRLRGYLRLKRRDFDGAEADLGRGIARQPDRADAYYDRAMARASLGRMAEALTDASKAIELDPEEGDYRQLRGEFHRALGHRREANADFEAAATLRADAQ